MHQHECGGLQDKGGIVFVYIELEMNAIYIIILQQQTCYLALLISLQSQELGQDLVGLGNQTPNTSPFLVGLRAPPELWGQ